jgi:protoporphyrinogen oxidase
MSLHWVDGRIPRPPVEDIIKSAIGIKTEGYAHQAIFSYPVDGGIKALVRAIARPVEPFIKTGFRITSITKSGENWEISNGDECIAADQCICTMPLQHLLPCLDNVPMKVKNAARALKYNSLMCVNIGIRGSVPQISWLYVPDPAIGRTNRISFPSGYSRHVAPEGCSAILAEITHQPGDEVAGMTDSEIISEVVEMLQAMQILGNDKIVYSSVERQPFAYVVYDLDYQKNIAVVKEYCKEIGIPLVGRFAQFEYLNMDGCIRSVMDFIATKEL